MENNELEKLIKFDEEYNLINPEEFQRKLRHSQVQLPVRFSQETIDAIKANIIKDNVSKNDVDFEIQYITSDNGDVGIPIFTSKEIMDKNNLLSSTLTIYADEIVDLIEDDSYFIVINPFTDRGMQMTAPEFKEIFDEDKLIAKALQKKSMTLEEGVALYLGSDDEFMKDQAQDGIFTAQKAFYASTNKSYQKKSKYLNILLMSENKKILFLGDEVGEDDYDILIAPGTQFKYMANLDEHTLVWECEKQPFYD